MLKRLGAFFLDVGEVIVFAVGIFFFIYLLILRPHKISGISMSPKYPDSEYLLTERVTYYGSNPQRGDVVVFTPPVSTDDYIKRVIGLPGERIMVQGGKVYINGKLLKESYLADTVYTDSNTFLQEGIEYTVPDGQYIVMGDNRPHSYDSRAWGPIKKSVINGKAWIIYWPVKSAGVIKRPSY